MRHVKQNNQEGVVHAYKGEDFPLDGTHPDHPELYRVTTGSFTNLTDDKQPHPCAECLEVRVEFPTLDEAKDFLWAIAHMEQS